MMMLLAATALAMPPRGISVELASESDQFSDELLLDLGWNGIVVNGTKRDANWLPLSVSWAFMEDQQQSQKIVDRLEFALLRTERSLENDRAAISVGLLPVVYDYDMTLLDATAIGGSLAIDVLDDLLRVRLGLDLRFRGRMTYTTMSNYTVVVGFPIALVGESPPDLPWFAAGEIQVRPNPVAWGSATFFLDTHAWVTGGYTVLDGDELDVRLAVTGSRRTDGHSYAETGNGDPMGSTDPFQEWTVSSGVSLLF